MFYYFFDLYIKMVLTQGLGSVPVARIIADTLTDSGGLVAQVLDISKLPRSKLLNCRLMRIMLKRDVARNASVIVNAVDEIVLLLGKVVCGAI
jgi:hypothetical protein